MRYLLMRARGRSKPLAVLGLHSIVDTPANLQAFGLADTHWARGKSACRTQYHQGDDCINCDSSRYLFFVGTQTEAIALSRRWWVPRSDCRRLWHAGAVQPTHTNAPLTPDRLTEYESVHPLKAVVLLAENVERASVVFESPKSVI